ncbi:alkaline dihydroceramidase like protein [Zymoseptoria brevis]|uniref:Alkaline dihydroceramidase like protein n=1 Tax=Zymoseptoria brevis TaxID=1047168 RepID=A0A0F4GY27_9PEZI|nr:alkaline dihydroceramidase like protein [Zymoseptoria brevis]
MVRLLPSIPYPPERHDGYWAPITSTLDWCEENYYATRYAAEIVNTLTNLLFAFLAIKGMYNCYKHGHDRVFFVTFLGYFFVGTGSFAFHATLKYPMQLVDELSMIYTTLLMFWATFEYRRSLPTKIALGFFVTFLAVFITLYYHFLGDPTFHQNAYAILTAIVLIRSMVTMELNIRPYFRNRARDAGHGVVGPVEREEERRDERDTEILRKMWTLIIVGLGVFLGGFGIWTLDNEYCGRIRGWRHAVGLPWGVVLEGHGWWHLMTGMGAYCYIVWGIWLRHCLNGRQDEYELVWPGLFTSLPAIERKREVVGGKKMS